MRKLLATFAIASAAFAVVAQEPAPAKAGKVADQNQPAVRKKPEITLHVGDAPPALEADHWLQGQEVKSFEKGKIYVVEFWATWCGPCIVMMPHMAELQAQYKSKDVTFIGYTKKDNNNTLEKVQEFVKKRGPKLGYTFCFAEEPKVYEAWMTASGHGGIPCCYVVDRETKIAYMGHPMYLDLVLPKVVEGKFTPEDAKAVAAAEKDVDQVFEATGQKPEVLIKALADFEKKYPELNHIPYFVAPRLNALLKLKKYDDVKVVARNLMTKARKSEDDSLFSTLSMVLRGPESKDQKALLDLSIAAAEEALKLAGEKDSRALTGVALANLAAGHQAVGKEFGLKALEAAEQRMKVSTAMTISQGAIQANQKALGLEFAEKAMEIGGERAKPSLLAQLASTFVAQGDKATAAEYATKAVESAPQNAKAGIESSLAMAYLSAGEKTIANSYAKKAIEDAAEANKPIILFNLANAYYRNGEKVIARNYAEQSMELAPAQLQRQIAPTLRRIINDPEGKASDK